MSNRRFIKNAAFLFVSMAITKIVGALFKIPLANLLGGTGMGYFSTAYGLYSPIFALTAAGIPTAIMRTTARCAACDNLCRAAAVRKYAIVLFSAIGFIGTTLITLLAQPFANYIAGSPKSVMAIICIAPAVTLCCIASVFRGYREGLSDVRPSAAASVAEAISRAVFGLSLSYAAVYYARNAFYSGNDVFGVSCSTVEQAYNASLPYAAAGAILAVSISEGFGLLTLLLLERKSKNKPLLSKNCEYSVREIWSSLMRETLPLSASALVMNCVSFVDLLTVTRAISSSIEQNKEFYILNFGAISEQCGGFSELANFMYGSYTGIATSLFMLIPSFAGMASTAAAPEIAAAWEKKDVKLIAQKISLQIKTSTLIACPACFGAAALAGPILNLLYKSRSAEVSVCVNSFIILCLGGLFMVISSALFGIFQSIGKPYIPLTLMIFSVLLKFILNPVLISIPELNISGAALSSVIGYMFTAFFGLLALKRQFPQKTGLLKVIVPNLINGILCGIFAKIIYECLKNSLSGLFSVGISVVSGAMVCATFTILSHFICTNAIINKKIEKN
ncbi:MAG: polysaccharide biosynthesis C-terminal domain-containing protein [Oscillospiraceae bacterium]|nr:polysaccharide biosynthesis C-terminal domain-containing protein [Oscillospiraceae bacterium]